MQYSTVIVSGGYLDEHLTLSILSNENTHRIIGVDRGIHFLYDHKITPSILLGDMDSVDASIIDIYRKEQDIPILTFNPVKDATDTEIALRYAIEQGWNDIVILGATGKRHDHLLGNIQILMLALNAGIHACILDPYNRIRLFRSGFRFQRDELWGTHFSLFSLGDEVKNLNLTGAKYPLAEHTVSRDDSLCVSNEIGDGCEEIEITWDSGVLIFMESGDEAKIM